MSKLFLADNGDLCDTTRNFCVLREKYSYCFMRPVNTLELRSSLRQPHAYGSYDIVAITNDGSMLCNKCAKSLYCDLSDDIKNGKTIAFECTSWLENGETCDNCDKWLDAYHTREEWHHIQCSEDGDNDEA